MPFMKLLVVATLTSNREDSGTERNKLVFIMNQNGLDVVHQDLWSSGRVDTGSGTVYGIDPSERQVRPENYYMRIGTRSTDAWKPSIIAVWCKRFTAGEIVPLGYDEEINTVLSSDWTEGRISLPVRQIGRGGVRTAINRVMLVTVTGEGWKATDSPIHVRITAGQSVVVDHQIPDTTQDDLESNQGNIYFLPVLSPFTRSQLTDSSIVLSIEGGDAWQPGFLAMFGLDMASGQPGAMVPLVHVWPWTFGALSTDADDEAEASVTLPLAPMDP